MAMAKERRWIVLSEDGRHISIGRASDPDETELVTLVDALRSQNTGGWLAVMEGDYHGAHKTPVLMMVRVLTPCTVTWDNAAAAFQQRRMQSLSVA
jgi:hypothetical protein